MTIFLIGLIIFFGLHLYSAFRSREPGRDRRKNWGEPKYMGLYSLAALIGFGLIIYGWTQWPDSGFAYAAPDWGRYVNYALMLPAMVLIVASQLPAGQIKLKAKHPMLVSVKLWALGHLLSNGEWRSVILFGAFLAYAVIDRIAVKRRATGSLPAPQSKYDVIAVGVGLGAYVALIAGLHGLLFGRYIWPV